MDPENRAIATPPELPEQPEPIGQRATMTETKTRWFNADGQLTGESTTVQRTYVADDKPEPGGYL